MTDPADLFTYAMRDLITMFSSADMDLSWVSLNCGEVNALCVVLELGGQVCGDPVGGRHAARMVLGQHATGDEPGDDHYFPVGQRVRFIGDGVYHGRLGEVTEVADPIGIAVVKWDNGDPEPVHVIDLEAQEEQ